MAKVRPDLACYIDSMKALEELGPLIDSSSDPNKLTDLIIALAKSFRDSECWDLWACYHALALGTGHCKPTLDGRCLGCVKRAELVP